MDIPLWAWLGFILGVLGLLALDLGVFHRKSHVVGVKEAAIWSAVWVTLGLSFGFVVSAWLGPQKGLEYFTGYVLEKSLAVDNIFVFVMVFSYFAIPPIYQHRVLYWGIIGAIIMRGIMIAAGAALISQFNWVLYIFGGFLLITGLKMLFSKQKEDSGTDLEKNPLIRLVRRIFKVDSSYIGNKFFITKNGVRMATPLFLALMAIEFTDLVFAVDSIPAIFAVTKDPFIVFTSNILAILGLRSMYFLLASFVDRFIYLKTGLSLVLVFIGIKMLGYVSGMFKVPIALSLGLVVVILAISILASLIKTKDAGAKVNQEPALSE